MDRIHIRDIEARCIVGIRDWERKKPQEVRISMTLHVDLSKACRSDRIEDTVDYKAVKDRVIERVESTSYDLVERMAQEAADLALEDPRVARVDVMVDKLGALRFTRSVAVEIFRSRGE